MIRAYDLQPDGTVRNMRVHYKVRTDVAGLPR
jgi:hypothetical protein